MKHNKIKKVNLKKGAHFFPSPIEASDSGDYKFNVENFFTR